MSGSLLMMILIIPLFVPWIVRAVWPHRIKTAEVLLTSVASALIAVVVYAVGSYSQMHDVEIWNGEVVSKQRVHGHYLRSYSCNCRQVCSGSGNNRSCSEQCDTCYEDRYTVNWYCNTNIGRYTIESLDETSRSVYKTPDPQRYSIINVGDPVAKRNSYINYVKAAPDSLFHVTKVEKFKDMVPPYPDGVYDLYRLNRVLAVKVNVPDLAAWNVELSNVLKTLGPQRQANAIIVFVNTADQSYVHALEGQWIGGKKNDIIVVIGTTSYPKIDWVHVSSWTDSQIFKVQLRDEIMAKGVIDRTHVLESLKKHTMATYKRKEMKDFEYLRDQSTPPIWVIILALILGIGTTAGLSYYFYKHDPL